MKAIKQFFTNRLNKDNFWNMMLPFGFIMGCDIAGFIPNTKLAMFVRIASLIAMIYIVKRKQAISFDTKKGKFIRSTGTAVQSCSTWLHLMALVGAIYLTIFFSPTQFISLLPLFIQDLIMALTIFGAIPIVFCILNYPISIMFNQHMWQGNSDGINRSSSSIHNSSIGHKAFCSSNSTTGLSYSSLSSNVHSSRY